MSNAQDDQGGYPYRRSWAAHAAALAAALLIGFGLREAVVRFPRGLLTDDAYFCAKIAYNLAQHGISSFDGVHVTDGYHLLWTWMLSGLSWVMGLVTADRAVHLSAMISLYLFLGAGIGLRFGRSWPAVLLFGLLAVAPKMLMETTLLALLALMLAEELLGRPAGRARPGRIVLLTFLIPLARIDGVLFPLILAAGVAFRRPAGRRVALATGAGTVAGTAAQLLANHAIAGHWWSVSAALKAGELGSLGEFASLGALGSMRALGANVATNLGTNLSGHYWGGLVAFVCFGVVLLLAAAAVRGMPAGARAPWDRGSLVTLLVASGGYVGLHLVANETMRYWYYVPSLYLLGFALQEAAPSSRWAGRMLRVGWIVLVAGILGKYAADSHLRREEIAHARTFTEQLRQIVPEQALIFQVDGTGYTGFVSGRRVVSGDGLVNTHDYARRLEANGLGGYLREEAIGYLVTTEYPRGDTLLAHHGLIVTRQRAETLIAPPPGLARLTAFGLHRLRDPRARDPHAPVPYVRVPEPREPARRSEARP